MATDKQVEYVMGLQAQLVFHFYTPIEIERMTNEEISKSIKFLKSKKEESDKLKDIAITKDMNNWQMNMWKE